MEDIMGFAVDTMKLCLDNPERFRIVCREEETSTNTAVKEKAREGEEEGYLLIAERQTAGRGRLGRTFESPEQTGLYMSLLLRPDCEPKKALHITTAAAVAVAEAIRELTGRKAEIKWVNDVYVDGRKVCGILTESALDAGSGRMAYAVLGIGVNVTEPKEGFARTIAHIAGALYDFGQEPEAFREKLAAEICNRFLALYPDMHSVRLAERYRALSLMCGRRIAVIDDITKPELMRKACVLAIDDDFGLRVRLEDGSEETLHSGDVSLRLTD